MDNHFHWKRFSFRIELKIYFGVVVKITKCVPVLVVPLILFYHMIIHYLFTCICLSWWGDKVHLSAWRRRAKKSWCGAEVTLMFMYVRLWQQCGCVYLYVVAGTASGPDTQTEGCFPHGTCSGYKRLSSSLLLTIHLNKLNHVNNKLIA